MCCMSWLIELQVRNVVRFEDVLFLLRALSRQHKHNANTDFIVQLHACPWFTSGFLAQLLYPLTTAAVGSRTCLSPSIHAARTTKEY